MAIICNAPMLIIRNSEEQIAFFLFRINSTRYLVMFEVRYFEEMVLLASNHSIIACLIKLIKFW